MSLKKAVACIKKYKRFLITSHRNPEGDALGAELAFYYLLKKLGKSAEIVNEDGIPWGYDFIPGSSMVKTLKRRFKKSEFDCFVALDSSDLKRIGSVAKLIGNKPILNIDHHISNQKFGAVNWIEPQASSCSEMIYRLYKEMKVRLDKNSALCLYVGILTDTGSFRYLNTTSFTHEAVSELLRFHINVPQIYRYSYENIPFADMQLLARILPGMQRDAGGKIIWFEIKQQALMNKKVSFDLSEHILSFGRAIKGVEVVMLFKENLGEKKEIRVNFRSQGNVDVNKIAQSFGGGGHPTASGATLHGNISTIRKKIVEKVRTSL